MRVWIYDDEGVGVQGLAQCQSALARYFQAEIRLVDAEAIKAGIAADMLWIGGGADLPYCRKLHGAGVREIKRFVAAGGVYVGICAGAYFACQQVDFTGEGYRIYGTRELALFQGIGRGSLPQLVGGRYYDLTEKTQTFIRLPEFPECPMRYHGGCAFIGAPERVIAHYPTPEALPAMIAGRYGRGAYCLSGVHFEAAKEGAVFFAKLRAIIEEMLHLAALSTCKQLKEFL